MSGAEKVVTGSQQAYRVVQTVIDTNKKSKGGCNLCLRLSATRRSPLAATQVWTALYTIMGLSAREVWKLQGLQGIPLALYAAQLALNFAWSPLFFLKHEIGLALVDISGAIAAGSA